MIVQVFDHMEYCTEKEVNKLLPQVPEWRQQQALQFHHTFGQFCCLKSWVMLQELLVQHTAPSGQYSMEDIRHWRTDTTGEGKPYFAEHPDIYFSISHCREGIAVAVSHHPVGIDIEARDRKHLFEPEDGTDFVEWWTRMEAIVKMRGTGITQDWKQTVCQDGEIVETRRPSDKKYVYSIAKAKKQD